MTSTELLEQAKTLSRQERAELIQKLTSMQQLPTPSQPINNNWGQQVNQLRADIGTIKMAYPELEDPVEWLQQIRADEKNRRLPHLGDDV